MFILSQLKIIHCCFKNGKLQNIVKKQYNSSIFPPSRGTHPLLRKVRKKEEKELVFPQSIQGKDLI